MARPHNVSRGASYLHPVAGAREIRTGTVSHSLGSWCGRGSLRAGKNQKTWLLTTELCGQVLLVPVLGAGCSSFRKCACMSCGSWRRSPFSAVKNQHAVKQQQALSNGFLITWEEVMVSVSTLPQVLFTESQSCTPKHCTSWNVPVAVWGPRAIPRSIQTRDTTEVSFDCTAIYF